MSEPSLASPMLTRLRSWLHRRAFSSMPWDEQKAYFVRHAVDVMARSFRGYRDRGGWSTHFFPIKPRESEAEYCARIADEVRATVGPRIASGERSVAPIA